MTDEELIDELRTQRRQDVSDVHDNHVARWATALANPAS